MRFFFFLVAALLLTAPAAARNCPFKYNNHVRYGVVLPALVAAGESDAVFDTEKPFVEMNGNTIVLLFHFRQQAMDAPEFQIDLESCTLKVLRAFRINEMLSPSGR